MPGPGGDGHEAEGDELPLEVPAAHLETGQDILVEACPRLGGDGTDADIDVTHPVQPVVGHDLADEGDGHLGVARVVELESQVDELVRVVSVRRLHLGDGVDGVHLLRHHALDVAHEALDVGGVHDTLGAVDHCVGHLSPFLLDHVLDFRTAE